MISGAGYQQAADSAPAARRQHCGRRHSLLPAAPPGLYRRVRLRRVWRAKRRWKKWTRMTTLMCIGLPVCGGKSSPPCKLRTHNPQKCDISSWISGLKIRTLPGPPSSQRIPPQPALAHPTAPAPATGPRRPLGLPVTAERRKCQGATLIMQAVGSGACVGAGHPACMISGAGHQRAADSDPAAPDQRNGTGPA